MLLLLSAVAAASGMITPPAPIGATDWIKDEDYPKEALRSNERGYFLANISVSANGAPLHCEPVQVSALSRAACAIVLQRARFEPASDVEGRAVTSVYPLRANFRLRGAGSPAPPVRYAMDLTVDHLPAGTRDPAYTRIAFHVDADGAMGACTPTISEPGERQDVMRLLGEIACGQIGKSYVPPIARDAAGAGLPSVQSVIVRFHTPAMRGK